MIGGLEAGLRQWAEDGGAGLRLLRGLPRFLHRPITSAQAHVVLRRRLDRRDARFVSLVRRAIYDVGLNPCRRLLDLAGCEAGDFARLVEQEGVEGALLVLYRKGVYLTLDEFKGRRPIVRGSATVPVDPSLFANPDSVRQFSSLTSGSRGRSTVVVRDLPYIRDVGVNRCVSIAARGGLGWRTALWGSPGITLAHLLEFASFGMRPARWFLFVDPASPSLPPRYRWSVRLVPWASRLVGAPLAAAEYVPIADPLPIIRWIQSVLRAGQTPHLSTFPSSAVRLCQAAVDAGIDLQGLQLTVAAEPLTAARLEVMQRSGAVAVPRYAIVEFGAVGYGCLAPAAADDNHLMTDLLAVIQPGPSEDGGALPERALLFTTLSPTAPLVVLNVSMGDEAELNRRSCGCALESLGWTTHLHAIRSFEKLTAAGVTIEDVDIGRVLDEVLPARFGGAPTDYQLVEAESEPGRPRLRLLVHPRLGPIDETDIAETFLRAIGLGRGSEPVFVLLLREADALVVERRPPLATQAGKILHLHGPSPVGTSNTE